MEIKSTDKHNISDISHVCIVISKPESEQLHTGFFFRNIEDKVMFLHLAWFDNLLYEEPSNDYYWLDIPLDEFDLMQIQLRLEHIYEKNGQGFPYGIAIDGIKFENDGTLSKEEHSGLTCATFVIRTLQSLGYNIINLDGWEIREEDKDWQEKIISALKNYWKTTDEFVTKQKEYIGNVPRFKPNEVVAATANADKRPLEQETVIELGEKLLEDIKELYRIQQGG
ncbi:hypothetical protein ACH5BF_03120 [Arcobacter sp. YIC-464]|uniref:hypothetical protein n=1 Tax=Arcobacter sp. YIC-464 TaxID=3376631 RepID=UPI003C20A54D